MKRLQAYFESLLAAKQRCACLLVLAYLALQKGQGMRSRPIRQAIGMDGLAREKVLRRMADQGLIHITPAPENRGHGIYSLTRRGLQLLTDAMKGNCRLPAGLAVKSPKTDREEVAA